MLDVWFRRVRQALIEPDGRILLMYHGSTCLPKSDPKYLAGERLGIAEAAHWNASFVKRPGGPIVAPSNGTGSHGASMCAMCSSMRLARHRLQKYTCVWCLVCLRWQDI